MTALGPKLKKFKQIIKTKEYVYINIKLVPFMVAVNTVNYGKPYKLSCAEALAGGLHIAGFYQNAYNLMNKFKWGPTFFKVNA